METKESLELVRQSVLCLLEETINSHQGVYLEEGTSVFPTVGGIDADLASRGYDGLGETIAGHANHLRYYIRNSLDMLKGAGNGDFDVKESWAVTTVDAAGWNKIRDELSSSYGELMSFVARVPVEQYLPGLPALLGIVAHTAYHLSAIRQLKDLKTASGPGHR